MKDLVTTLRNSQRPSDRKVYVPVYKGFEEIFGIPLIAGPKDVHIKWSDDVMALGPDGPPFVRLMHAVRSAMDRLVLLRDQFDVVLIHLPDKWQIAFRGVGFDARDSIKALGASLGIPTQVINDHAFTFPHKASIAWRLAIALYVKAGGIPWKLAPLPGVPDGSAYIGLAYALRGKEKEAHYITCCSQVFDADGSGMQFVAFEARDPVEDPAEARRNPFLSRRDMRAVMARSLALYQQRNGGAVPRRLVIHKTTSFKPDELGGCMDALSGVKEIECIEVGSSPRWRGIWLKKSDDPNKLSEPSGYSLPRGIMQIRTGTSALLWVAGNAPTAAGGRDYFQGGKSIPRPINLIRHAAKGSMELTALEALALTKVDWNNDALYDPVPVTIRYSQRLARTIANVPTLPGRAYAYRLFM